MINNATTLTQITTTTCAIPNGKIYFNDTHWPFSECRARVQAIQSLRYHTNLSPLWLSGPYERSDVYGKQGGWRIGYSKQIRLGVTKSIFSKLFQTSNPWFAQYVGVRKDYSCNQAALRPPLSARHRSVHTPARPPAHPSHILTMLPSCHHEIITNDYHWRN